MSEDDSKKDTKNQGQNDSQDAGQVIRFPLERLKAQRRAKKLAEKNKQQKKVTLFLSVASIFVLAAYLNNNSQTELQNIVQKEGMERMVANSELTESEIADRNKELAESLDESTQRVPASYGRRPSAIERLRYGKFLRYKVNSNNSEELITDITLSNYGGGNEKPVSIGSAQKFLITNRKIIAPTYENVQLLSSETIDDQVIEVYSLISEAGEEVGRAQMKFTLSGYFLQMLVQEDRQKIQE